MIDVLMHNRSINNDCFKGTNCSRELLKGWLAAAAAVDVIAEGESRRRQRLWRPEATITHNHLWRSKVCVVLHDRTGQD